MSSTLLKGERYISDYLLILKEENLINQHPTEKRGVLFQQTLLQINKFNLPTKAPTQVFDVLHRLVKRNFSLPTPLTPHETLCSDGNNYDLNKQLEDEKYISVAGL